MDFKQWSGFAGETWKTEINVRNFIKKNYTPFLDDPTFLCGPTERTQKSMEKLNALLKQERDNGGVLDIDVTKTTTLTSHAPGYLDKDTKKLVDEIVKVISEDNGIAELYELWYKCRCESYRTYTDVMPERLPFEANEEFKSIRTWFMV